MAAEGSWRFIDSGALEASYNMALDEALSEGARAGGPPVLRFFAWRVPSVTLGGFQRSSDVDMEYCRAEGIPVVRRPTGGRAILHGHELTYSFCAGFEDGLFAGDLFKSYGLLSRAFLGAFMAVGLDASASGDRGAAGVRSPLCFRSTSYGEITVRGRKIIGSAQRRYTDGMLQQGSIPFVLDRAAQSRVFMTGGLEDEQRSMLALNEELPSLGIDELKRAIVESFAVVFGVSLTPSVPSELEHLRALELQVQKYESPRWTLRR